MGRGGRCGWPRSRSERLGDPENGGYFAAGADPRLLLRAKPGFDGAVASGNGVAALNAIELARLTRRRRCGRAAEATLRAFADGMTQAPIAHVTLVRALERLRQLERPAASSPRVVGPSAAPEAGPAGAPVAEPAVAAPQPSLEDEAYDAVEVPASSAAARTRSGSRSGSSSSCAAAGTRTRTLRRRASRRRRSRGVLGRLRNVRYPAGESWDGGAGPVPVYRGRVVIEGEIEHRGGGAPAVELAYQACDDARCLPAVTRIVRLK